MFTVQLPSIAFVGRYVNVTETSPTGSKTNILSPTVTNVVIVAVIPILARPF